MKRSVRNLAAFSILLAGAAALRAPPADNRVTETFHDGGAGGGDYMAVDPGDHLLFVPRSTHTMVLDEATGKTVADIPGQKRNHGVALVPSAGRGFISDGGDGSVVIFDLKTFAVLGRIKAEADADGIIYDRASNKVLVVSGDGGVLIPVSPDVDPRSGHADPAINLGGKPEFLAADGRGRVYINLVNKAEVAVVDTKTMKVLDHWPTAPGGTPVGMSMDRAHRRLFIGCRNPRRMIVMNADDGTVIADLPIGAVVDATRYDDGNAFASCGDGTVTVIRQNAAGKFEGVQSVPTMPGARTMDIDPKTHALYLPTAELEPRQGSRWPGLKPGTFRVLVVSR